MFCGQCRISSNLYLLNPTRNITVCTPLSAKNLYDSLGLTPKATQTDIKTAYYKMSMLYHPDKNKGSKDAAQKFKDINAAYEVLGNLRLRRKYDRGILHTEGPLYTGQDDEAIIKATEDDAQTKFYKSRTSMHKAPTPTGRSPIYDFDEWSRAHYGESFARKEAAKLKYNRKTRLVMSDSNESKKEFIMFSIAMFIVAFFGMACARDDYDVVPDKPIKLEGNQIVNNNSGGKNET